MGTGQIQGKDPPKRDRQEDDGRRPSKDYRPWGIGCGGDFEQGIPTVQRGLLRLDNRSRNREEQLQENKSGIPIRWPKDAFNRITLLM